MSRRARQELASHGVLYPPHIEDYAFNPSGWHMKVPDGPWKEKLVIINAYEPSSTQWAKGVEKDMKTGKPGYRTSLDLSAREISPDEEAGLKQYVVMGFAWPGLSDKIMTKPAGLKKQQGVGRILLPGGEITRPDSCDSHIPLLVVTPIIKSSAAGEDETEDTIRIFALVCPHHGLCRPFVISGKHCFYLARFRDDTTDVKSRGPSWNRKVLQDCIRAVDISLSVKQEKYKKARNTSMVDLEAAESDLKCVPAPENDYVIMFVDQTETEWEDKDSCRMLKELSDMWPDIFCHEGDEGTGGPVTPERITLIKKSLIAKNAHVEYHLLQFFLLEACFDLWKQDGEGNTTTVEAIVLRCLERTQFMLPPESRAQIPAHVPIDAASGLHLLRSVRGVDAGKQYDKAMKESLGDQTTRGTGSTGKGKEKVAQTVKPADSQETDIKFTGSPKQILIRKGRKRLVVAESSDDEDAGQA